MSDQCPCMSKLDYSSCCGPFIGGESVAPSAEKLMRSRYTAYAKGNTNYILQTCRPDLRKKMNDEEIKAWSEGSNWKGLEIVNTEAGQESDDHGMVEFIAKYETNGQSFDHHEKSIFEKIDNAWYFVDGNIVGGGNVKREGPKVGRNDPCPCGSGKKFKKCCS